MWAAALATEAVQTAIAGRTQFRQQTVRMFGLPESALADTLRDAQATVQGFERLEITTCLRRGELEIVTRYEPADAAAYSDLLTVLRDRHTRAIFSEDGASVDDQIAGLLDGRSIATAESCTAGLLAARLTEQVRPPLRAFYTMENASGMLPQLLGRYDLADKAYEKAVKVAGRRPEILNNMGYSYFLRGERARARKTFEEAARLAPENPVVKANLGLVSG